MKFETQTVSLEDYEKLRKESEELAAKNFQLS